MYNKFDIIFQSAKMSMSFLRDMMTKIETQFI